MHVKINNYKGWVGPHQLSKKILFWIDDNDDRVFKFGNWLAHGKYVNLDGLTTEIENRKTVLSKFLDWMHSQTTRKVYVKIDEWDTWSMDHTLSLIIVPMLKQLKEKTHGGPFVDPEDVQENLQPTDEEVKMYNVDGTTDAKFFERWDYVLDEMIFAFEHIANVDWKDEFSSGEIEFNWVKSDNIYVNPITQKEESLYSMERGKNHTYEVDYDGMQKVEDRINNGLRLFGKYYRALWD